VPNALGEVLGLDLARSWGDDHELVAAVSRENVIEPDAVLHPRADDAERSIAGRVTKSVVHLLQAVDIRHEKREGIARTSCTRDLGDEAIGQVPAIENIRKRITDC
jgi:hypothetical protein